MIDPYSPVSLQRFLEFLKLEANIRVDNLLEGAIEVAEQVHSGLLREDGISHFLETHTWPVAMDVVRHYRLHNRNITSVEVVASILHDIMEDDERILDLFHSKSYGFEAYMEYRFGPKIQETSSRLKVPPIGNFAGADYTERELARFQSYCDMLLEADYDIKAIKLADRLNNMAFIGRIPGHDKAKRYLREAEDFYIAYTMMPPKMPDYYHRIREQYENLRTQRYVLSKAI